MLKISQEVQKVLDNPQSNKKLTITLKPNVKNANIIFLRVLSLTQVISLKEIDKQSLQHDTWSQKRTITITLNEKYYDGKFNKSWFVDWIHETLEKIDICLLGETYCQ